MRPVYSTANGQQSSSPQRLLQQQYPTWQLLQQHHAQSQQLQPITPAAVAALAMSSFSRSNASYSAQQTYPGPQLTNTLGYSLSSTYVPSRDDTYRQHDSARPYQPQEPRLSRQPRPFLQPESQPGSDSPHPSKKRKREDEPPIPIPGTGIMLNTPEAIEAWIAERKARWPSAKRLEEKNAANKISRDRGEIKLDPGKQRLPGNLRNAVPRGRVSHEGPRASDARGYQHRRHGHGRQADGPVMKSSHDSPILAHPSGPTHPSKASNGRRPPQGLSATLHSLIVDSDPASSTEEGDNSDVDPIADAVSSKVHVAARPEPKPSSSLLPANAHTVLRPTRIVRPRTAPNHLASSTTKDLMRALLSTEIRATVSRLSQSVRFLVDNDFLMGVEERVGEAKTMAHVVILPTPATNDGEQSERKAGEQ